MKTISTQITNEQHHDLKIMAIKTHIPMSIFIRQAISDYLGKPIHFDGIPSSARTAEAAITPEFDDFIGSLATMAKTGQLHSGTHFKVKGNQIALRLKDCLTQFQQHFQKTFSLNMCRNQARKCNYVEYTNHTVRFKNNSIKKCCLISIHKAQQAGIDTSGFMSPCDRHMVTTVTKPRYTNETNQHT